MSLYNRVQIFMHSHGRDHWHDTSTELDTHMELFELLGISRERIIYTGHEVGKCLRWWRMVCCCCCLRREPYSPGSIIDSLHADSNTSMLEGFDVLIILSTPDKDIHRQRCVNVFVKMTSAGWALTSLAMAVASVVSERKRRV